MWGKLIVKRLAIGMAWVNCDSGSLESVRRSEKMNVRAVSVNEGKHLPLKQTHVPGGHWNSYQPCIRSLHEVLQLLRFSPVAERPLHAVG